MPKLDGFGVLQKIKEDKIKVPVLISSNLSQGGRFMFDDGIEKVLTGITSLDELTRVIRPSI